MSYVVTPARIRPINPVVARGRTLELFAVVRGKMGMVPNLMKTMAHSPAVLEGYLALSGALSKGVLPAAVREQLALLISQTNGCEYCVSAHSLLGKHAGLSPEQIIAARKGESSDPKVQAIMTLAGDIMDYRGDVSDEQLAAAREAGVTDPEMAEIVAHIALLSFTNYLNEFAHTDLDFPRVSLDLH